MASTPFIVRNGHGSADTCLDAELLASFIDGRATTAERTRVEAHLARCEDCYFVFSESFQEQGPQAADAATTDVNPRPKPMRIVWRMGAGLAAAAVIVLAVQVYRTGTRQEDQALVVALNELQAAAGPSRPFEARLSGAYPYRPLAGAVRSGSTSSEASLALREAALKVELAARGQSLGPEERRALAAMYVTLNQPQRAADVVAPIAQSTTDPEILNDSAVAYLARGGEGDAQRAQDLLEQAVASDSSRVEAWFNLGLAAEAAGDLTRARDAWTRYLVIDPSSPWAAEARAHLAKTTQPVR